MVTNTEGAPVGFATVRFTDESNPDKSFVVYTNAHGKYTFDFSLTTGIDAPVPVGFSLGQNFPNPFNPSTMIPFTLYSPCQVHLVIYTVTGQKVTAIINSHMGAGSHCVAWNGMDDQGNRAGAGIYLYRLRTGARVETKKMLLLDGGDGSHSARVFKTLSTNNIAETYDDTTYTITVTRTGIIPYKKEGVSVIDGQMIDFVVSLIQGIKIIEGLTLVAIPAGTFSMGLANGSNDAQPEHSVTFSSFEMSVYEITQGLYKEIIGSAPSHFSEANPPEENHNLPVETVSWRDAITFCNVLSKKTGLDECYTESSGDCDFTKNGFRLPTEAEWEYACRAGTTTLYYPGDAVSDLDRAGWYQGNSFSCTHPVGLKTPNAWGLYDMHGNVWEWCSDWYGSYTSSSQTDPVGPQNGSSRVIRGGSCSDYSYWALSAYRLHYPPDNRYITVGFRVVRRR